MKEQLKARFDEDGVSPVIGVILMVAVTVALVALVTVIVFDIGGDVSESPDATVELSQDGNNVTATVLRNENVESFEVVGAYNDSLDDGTNNYYDGIDGSDNYKNQVTFPQEMTSVGDSVTVQGTLYEDAGGDGGTYDDTTSDQTRTLSDGDQVQVIATMSDGSEQVLTTTTYDG